ncbi:serine protease [Gigaspora margarita]|uniref:Serine protease n=1 Tax=Gigaspora margarita TaxID=4874 RepID=A0A8H4AKW8_GIGMA|nr:serine protease [Gigaspora margarita]
MNKKFSHYLLIVLITMIATPSIASVISQSNNISDILAFRSSERINETSRFKNKYKRSKKIKSRIENKIYSRNEIVPPFDNEVNPNHNYPIGLFIADNGSVKKICTASVINSKNGNIGLTAAHCLLDDDGNPWNLSSLSFSPGYDNGTNGPLGAIPVVDTAMPHEYLINPNKYDYALVRFEFNQGGATLQEYTGALGWRFDIGNREPTSVYGYPDNGNFENCVHDGEHLCKWQGTTVKRENIYIIVNLTAGSGASGGPLISQYDAKTNLGYAYAVIRGYLDGYNVSIGSIWDEIVFSDLLLRITPKYNYVLGH